MNRGRGLKVVAEEARALYEESLEAARLLRHLHAAAVKVRLFVSKSGWCHTCNRRVAFLCLRVGRRREDGRPAKGVLVSSLCPNDGSAL